MRLTPLLLLATLLAACDGREPPPGGGDRRWASVNPVPSRNSRPSVARTRSAPSMPR